MKNKTICFGFIWGDIIGLFPYDKHFVCFLSKNKCKKNLLTQASLATVYFLINTNIMSLVFCPNDVENSKLYRNFACHSCCYLGLIFIILKTLKIIAHELEIFSLNTFTPITLHFYWNNRSPLNSCHNTLYFICMRFSIWKAVYFPTKNLST